MHRRFNIAKGSLALAAAAIAVSAAAVPSFASAQGYYDAQGGYYYDACKREKTNRGVAGALIGGALGAVIGSNAAARGVRTEGAFLGGALGAAAGAAVGNSAAACRSGQDYAYDRSGYYDRGYDNRYYDGRYYDGRTYGRSYGAGDYGAGYYGGDYMEYRNATAGGDGCRLAESPIYLPDGRTQQRFVRVCPDRYGRYQVVD